MTRMLNNKQIASRLREAAGLLERQDANVFRVNAYRKAASTLDSLSEDIGAVFKTDGVDGLTALPGIGPMIGGAIAEMLRTGDWAQLERLRGAANPVRLLSKVPGIGAVLGQNIVDELHIETLEDLETAAHDGRLARLHAFGPRRVAMIRSSLAEILGRWRSRPGLVEPSVEILLDVDREYRRKAETRELPRIAPKRFNPTKDHWLPILHTERGAWRFTVLFSNTELAHRLGRTDDWVVIYFHTDSQPEGQRTVVTENRGRLKDRRVVRGRERECLNFYLPEQLCLPLEAA